MVEFFDPNRNKVFIGNTERLAGWLAESAGDQTRIIIRVQNLIKNYLELDNVSFLFGSGASIHLGAVAIRNFPREVEQFVIKEKKLMDDFYSVIRLLQANLLKEKQEGDLFKDERGWEFVVANGVVKDNESKDIAIEYEKVLNYLIAKRYVLSEDKTEEVAKFDKLITCIKEGLFNVCNLENRPVSKFIIDRKKKSRFLNEQEQGELLEKKSKYIFHEKLIKSLLQRPLNLRRANIFTSNYDLAFEYAFDKLGVHYIDGFTGFHKRFFKPETFEYDIFYPGSTTAGKVQRIEKVVRYFKLHGSLSWINSEARDANNLYGIEEKPLELIESLKQKGEIIIYPSAIKKSYTLDFPYSELFRQFAATISQPQSVLITIGYAFADEHFNDIIFQALSNPTFTLIIVDFSGTKGQYIKEIKELNDPRIIIMEGDYFGDFLTFSDTLMPNFNNEDHAGKIATTLNELFNGARESKIIKTEEQ